MDKHKRKYLEAEIDNWLDTFEPMQPTSAPDGFVAKVLAAANRDSYAVGLRPQNGHFFWQSMAAGIALLVAVNLYTALSIKKADVKTDTASSVSLLDEQTVDADTYGNYSQLAYERINN